MKKTLLILILSIQLTYSQSSIRVLDFQGTAYGNIEHASLPNGKTMMSELAVQNGWQLTYIGKGNSLPTDLSNFDVIVFNNLCGDSEETFNNAQRNAFKSFINNEHSPD